MNHCMKCGKALLSARVDGFQRWVCPSCAWTHYNNPRPCVTAVIGDTDRVLLTRRAVQPGLGLWDLPGGFMEPGEHPEQALAREICEELGVGLKSTELLGFYPDVYGKEDIHILNIVFCCRIEGEMVLCEKEFQEIRWFGPKDLPGRYAFRSVAAILEDCLERYEGIDEQEVV